MSLAPAAAADDRRRAAERLVMILLNYALPLLFIVVPLASFLAHGFFSLENGHIIYRLTLLNYARFFGDPIYIPLFLRTCLLALEVAAIGVLLGYPIALLLASLEGRAKYAATLVFVIPLLMSYIIKIYAIRAILGNEGFLNKLLIFLGILDQPSNFLVFNLNAVLITLATILLPFTILPIFIALEKIPANLIEASSDLGAGGLQTFWRVVLPLSLPGTVVGASFTFVLAIGDFVTPEMVGGPNGFTFGRAVYSQFGLAYNWPFGAALSVMLLAVVMVAILAAGRLGRAEGALT
jgi:spermidine/putrescine transport system permease protein